MNTIMITEKDFNEKLKKYEVERYFENFIFNEFKIILKHDNYKVVYKIRIDKNINEVNYRMIKNGSYKDCKIKFEENEEGWKIVETPNGEIIKSYVENMINTHVESLSDEDVYNDLFDWINSEISFIYRLKQYIMNESYKRVTVQKEGRKIEHSDNKREKKNVSKKKVVVQFLLGDIVEYVNSNRREFKITCECWNVRGHFRHYKNGKVVWISEYEKGKKRNSNNCIVNRIYNI